MRSVCRVLAKQERLQVASEGGTVEIRVPQFIRQCIPSCRRSHGKGTTTIRSEVWITFGETNHGYGDGNGDGDSRRGDG